MDRSYLENFRFKMEHLHDASNRRLDAQNHMGNTMQRTFDEINSATKILVDSFHEEKKLVAEFIKITQTDTSIYLLNLHIQEAIRILKNDMVHPSWEKMVKELLLFSDMLARNYSV